MRHFPGESFLRGHIIPITEYPISESLPVDSLLPSQSGNPGREGYAFAALDHGWPEEINPLLCAALDNPKIGSVVFGANLRVLHATSGLRKLLGLLPGLLAPGTDLLQFLGSSTALDSASLAVVEATCVQEASRELCDPGGAPEPVSLSSVDGAREIAMEVRRIAQKYWIVSFEDVTIRRKAESHLLSLALTDLLTGLGNRAHFEQNVSVALARQPETAAAVIFLDLDRFKAVNDTLGHSVGDAVLRMVGQRMKSLMRAGDVAARLGGDEFAILISPALPHEDLTQLAGRLIDLLQRTYLIGGHVINVGASVGIAIAPQDGIVADRLLKSADLALYQSKASGRGTFNFFDPAMEQRAQARRNLELELRKALPMRQIEVHYQPQIDIASQKLTGLEARLCWQHPRRGLMQASEFVPLAEELGIAAQIGDWMLRIGCKEAAKWPESVFVSVITSRLQFESGRLVDSVEKALAAASISGTRIELQINENILLNNENGVLSTLHSLRALGVRVAMTDFGTGYASLSQLTSFPFDRITIDRSLTSVSSSGAKHRAIVRAIATLGASLGMSTMAEGIETAEDLARIHSDGCGALQGYLPAETVPSNELQSIIQGFV